MTFTYQEKGHRYELDGVKMTGVTTVLGVLAKPMLIPWAARMTAEWIRENCKNAYQDISGYAYTVTESDLQEAVKAHTKKKEDGGKGGKDLHSQVEGAIKDAIERYDGYMTLEVFNAFDPKHPIQSFVRWADENRIKFLSSETPTYSKEWFVAGTPDFTFEKDGKKFVGDLKSFKKIWDRVPHLQCAAYAKMLEEQSGEKYDGTCIVNINKETGELTDQWRFALDEDMRGFEAALTLYRLLNA